MKIFPAICCCNLRRWLFVLLLLLPGLWLGTPPAHAQGSTFAYQGQLKSGGAPVNGSNDLAFTLYNVASGGALVGASNVFDDLLITNGLFNVILDFGVGAFDGSARWLEIAVRPGESTGDYTTMAPRQPVLATPYAFYAAAANTAGNVTGAVSASQLTGTVPLVQLPATVVTNGASNVNFSGAFTGNGAGLTNLPPASLTGVLGPAQIPGLDASKITSGALNTAQIPTLDATTKLAGTLPDARLSANVALLNGTNVFTGTNRFVGVVIATNANSQFTGRFTGNGAGLTNLPPTSLTGVLGPAQIPNLDASKITTGTLPDARLTANVALLNRANSFVGTNQFAGVVRATNAANQFTGSFSGNGTQLTGIVPPPGMVLIPPGPFAMGNSIGDADIYNADTVTVWVSAFYMDVNLVSWSQWQSVYFWATEHGYRFFTNKVNGVYQAGGNAVNHPVQTVNWYDCVKWCNARSQQVGRPPVYYTDAGLTQVYTNGEPATLYPKWAASGFRLPTEAEWEKAARGGLSGQRFPWGNVINQNLATYRGCISGCGFTYDLGPNGLNPIGIIGGTALIATSPVGSFAANGYGLYDMAGNVQEWCWDWYSILFFRGNDPHGPPDGVSTIRVLRGGSWYDYASYLRCAHRDAWDPSKANGNVGFRCVRGL